MTEAEKQRPAEMAANSSIQYNTTAWQHARIGALAALNALDTPCPDPDEELAQKAWDATDPEDTWAEWSAGWRTKYFAFAQEFHRLKQQNKGE